MVVIAIGVARVGEYDKGGCDDKRVVIAIIFKRIVGSV